MPDNTDAQTLRHLFDEYAASVQTLRTAVNDVTTNLDSMADILKRGAILVRREHQRVAPPPSSAGH